MPREKTLDQVLDRNIQALIDLRKKIASQRRPQDRVTDAIAAFAGSIYFVYVHLAILVIWALWNLGWLGLRPFDPFPFTLLPSIASVEAIFLSTLLMINQNRMQTLEERREDLDLQVSLLTEHEITRLIRITDLIAQHIGIDASEAGANLKEMKKDVPATKVLERIDVVERDNAEAEKKK